MSIGACSIATDSDFAAATLGMLRHGWQPISACLCNLGNNFADYIFVIFTEMRKFACFTALL